MSNICYLEVEDASVVVTKALVSGNDSGHHIFIQGQWSNGSQQPAVTWTVRKMLSNNTNRGRTNPGPELVLVQVISSLIKSGRVPLPPCACDITIVKLIAVDFKPVRRAQRKTQTNYVQQLVTQNPKQCSPIVKLPMEQQWSKITGAKNSLKTFLYFLTTDILWTRRTTQPCSLLEVSLWTKLPDRSTLSSTDRPGTFGEFVESCFSWILMFLLVKTNLCC